MESRGDGEEPITHEELLKAQAHIYKHTYYFINSMSLKCAVELGIPDIIHNHKKPMTHSELVTALQIPQSRCAHLYRLMRILVHNGFFTTQKIHDHEEQLLSGWLKGGNGGARAPFDATHGKGLWEYGLEHLDVTNVLNEAMAADSRVVSSVFVTKYKAMFEGVVSLVDVGGGTGTMGRAIAEAFPHIKCFVLDVPHVVGSCQGSENLEFVAGDMFHTKIPSADAILLKWILHNWNNEDCLKILKRCREAIVSTEKVGKVIIIDIVVDYEKGETHESTELQLMFDMLLMVSMNGIERTETEWEKLFIESGFSSYKITPFLDFRSVIEVFP
ncbi:hypothetical protein Syun_027318 [Stephania yunnanensis]|uniref:O-methyltransferase n=1 Tax=Stephania yunnanensis TaxID=152371 RepID=A0AAP0EIR5_9MAGN